MKASIDTCSRAWVSWLYTWHRGSILTSDTTPLHTTGWDFPPGSLPLPLVIAHRGDRTNAPENTISAFKRALELGADGIELDVRLTKDGQLVVFHDRCLERTSNGVGPVNHCTQQEVLALDAGSWFGPEFKGEHPPTLDEVFESLPTDFLINVEMKVIMKGMRLIAHKTAEIVRRHARWDSTLVASFNPRSTAGISGPRTIRSPSGQEYSARWCKPIGTTQPTIPTTPSCTGSSKPTVPGFWPGTWILINISKKWPPSAWRPSSLIHCKRCWIKSGNWLTG